MMTRQTGTLASVDGELTIKDGKLLMKEKDGTTNARGARHGGHARAEGVTRAADGCEEARCDADRRRATLAPLLPTLTVSSPRPASLSALPLPVACTGIDYAASTVQTPGGERVPYLFTVKGLIAKGNADSVKPGLVLSGEYVVPSYRTGLFLDPKGRGTTTGYDMAVALPAMQAGGDDALFKENNKKYDVLGGSTVLTVTGVDAATGDFGGTFVSQQASDTDMGSKAPKTILLKGVWTAHIPGVDE